MRWLILLALACLPGCANLEHLADTLNTREVQSCIYTISFPWPFTVVRTITATGGVLIEECEALK